MTATTTILGLVFGCGLSAPAEEQACAATAETRYVEVRGDNDPSVPASNWCPLIGAIPKGQLVVLPESGHGPQHQYPVLSALYVTAFLQSAEG